MARRELVLIGLLLVGAALCAGCTQPPSAGTLSSATPTVGANGTQAPSAAISTTPDLIAFVRNAAVFARERGQQAALAAFNDPHGPFAAGDVRVFALDYNGTLLADPGERGAFGANISNRTDTFGIPFVRNLLETARFGRGFVSYDEPNPRSNAIAEPKLTVVEDVDGTYCVAAGFFASEGDVFPSTVLNTTRGKADVDDLVAFVKGGVAYAREHGRERALAAFNDPAGQFVRGELVIFALDRNGTVLASPPYAQEVQRNRINLVNYQDPDGVNTIRGMRALSRTGGGFLYTVAKVTVNGTDLYLPKIDYAEPVDDDWWLFSGIIDPAYAGAVSGNLSGLPVRNHSRFEVWDQVKRAADFAQANGKEQALAAIGDPKGPFVRGDLFVWAEGTDGTVLADPFWKEGVGKNYLDVTDAHGMKTTRVGIDLMEHGSGFSHALFANTTTNSTALLPKLVYMRPVDETWWIGGGIYGVEVKG
jgi:signal transduction histidine kinase